MLRKEPKKKGDFIRNQRLAGGSFPKYVPIADVPPERVFDFVFLTDESTINYLNKHGRIVFLLRGPSGTRKGLLADLISNAYKKSVMCSADDYFSAYLTEKRNHDSLKRSHHWCIQRLQEECERNAPCIILKNTHIRKFEIAPYMDVIRNHHYTVIVVETVRKFKVNENMLEKSNSKGLSADYLNTRLRQWEEYVPWFTGWFLNPTDSEYLFNKSQEVLSLFDDNEFKNCSSCLNEPLAKIKDKFSQEISVFCISSYCNAGLTDNGRALYLNAEIQENYGKMFELKVTAFLIMNNMLIAVCQLSPEQHKITVCSKQNSLPPKRTPRNELVEAMNNMKIKDDYGILNKNGKIDKKNSSLTFEVKEKNTEKCLTKYGFILLGREKNCTTSPLFSYLTNVNELHHYMSLFNEKNNNEIFSINEHKFCQINDIWIVELNCSYVGKSVFTGMH